MMKSFIIQFKNIGNQSFLRFDTGYRNFFDVQKNTVWSYKTLTNLGNVLEYLESKKVKKGVLEKEEFLIDIRDIERRLNNLTNLELVNEIGSDKNIIKNGDIILPKMTPRMGNIFLNLEHKRYLGSTELLEFKINRELFNPHLLYYLITNNSFLSILGNLESGKTHRRINIDDLLKIKIPLISNRKQDQIAEKIIPIENNIKKLKNKIEKPQDIINEVFAEEFNFDLGKFEELKNKKFFEIKISDLGKNSLLRFSEHFYKRKFVIIEERLKNKNKWIEIRGTFNLSGGKRIPKGSNFSKEETGFRYLRPNEISIWGIDKENMPFISKKIFEELKRYNIKTGEFCISIVGTLGKVAIVDLDELEIGNDNLILSENFVKLISKKKINRDFFFYYFYSFIFQSQVDREYTITSIKKLGLDKFNNIKIPNISLSHQNKIVENIKSRLDKQEEIKKEIEIERNKIDKIIELVVK